MRINNSTNQNFKALSALAAPLGQFYNANAVLPTLAIETGVTLGRAQQAKKRGGMPEAIDRLVEQGVSAVVWVFGVKAFQKIGEFIGKNFCGISDFNFDIGFDELRNPIQNIKNDKNLKKAFGFKAANLLFSTALATYFMASILPKINNKILAKTLKKEEDKTKTIAPMPTFNDFQKKTNKNISFTSLYDVALNSAHILENNSTARLLITDTGVIAGRFHNANNKYRKIEALFRDTTSIFFYLFSTPLIVKGLNKLTKNTDINPKTLEKIVELMKNNPNIELDDVLVSDSSTLKELFEGKKVISVDEFAKHFPEKLKKAKQMAKLQFVESGNGILSYQQACDVLSNSATSNPKFLKETYDYTVGKDVADKLTYVSSKSLDKIRKSIDNFVEQVKNSENKTLEQVANSTIRKNFAFNIIGTAISIYALATLIPKVQYWITQKLSHENKFHTENE